MSDLPGRPGNPTSPAHIPVLLREVLSHLELEAGQIVVDVKRGVPAWELLARISEHDLADVIFRYGEEPQSRRIARHLVEWRSTRPIRTSRDLATAVAAACSSRQSQTAARHPATRVFQAL